MAVAVDEMRAAGLLDDQEVPHLTAKGLDWLQALEGAHRDVVDVDACEDLVLSTSGLIR